MDMAQKKNIITNGKTACSIFLKKPTKKNLTGYMEYVCVLLFADALCTEKAYEPYLCVWLHSAIHGLKIEAIAEGQGWLAGGGYREKCVHAALTT